MTHTILVAFEVNADSFEDAQAVLAEQVLPCAANVNGITLDRIRKWSEDRNIECWWTAEDERYDGSDCDSAVFVPHQRQVLKQDDAAEVLLIMTEQILSRFNRSVYRAKHRRDQ
jgi:DNA/RNA endonuclease G (NUC1)